MKSEDMKLMLAMYKSLRVFGIIALLIVLAVETATAAYPTATDVNIQGSIWHWVPVKIVPVSGAGYSEYYPEYKMDANTGTFILDTPFNSVAYVPKYFDLPSDGSSLSLTVWGVRNIKDWCGDPVKVTVSLIDSNNKIHQLGSFTPVQLDKGVGQGETKKFSISNFAGQNVKIRIEQTSSGEHCTYGYFRDINLQTSTITPSKTTILSTPTPTPIPPLKILQETIAIEAEKTYISELETVRLMVVGVPGDTIYLEASPCASASFKQGIRDTHIPSGGCSFTDMIDSDGVRKYAIEFTDAGTYTIKAKVTVSPGNVRNGDYDTVDITVAEGEVAFDMPSTVVIGDRVKIKGTATSGSYVSVYVEDVLYKKLEYLVIEDGEFEKEVNTTDVGMTIPESVRLKAWIDCECYVPMDEDSTIDMPSSSPDGEIAIVMASPRLTPELSPPAEFSPTTALLITIIISIFLIIGLFTFKNMKGKPDLFLSRKLSRTRIKEGEEIHVEISIQNKDKKTAKSVSFSESMPVGLTASGETSWNDGQLTKNGKKTCIYLIKPTKDGIFTLNALVVNYEDENGKKYHVNAPLQKIIVEKRIPPDISVSRTLKTEVKEGEICDVSITLSNRGEIAKSVSFSEEIPDAFSFVSGDKSWNGDLKENESKTFKYKIKALKCSESIFESTLVKYKDERRYEYESKSKSDLVVVEKETPKTSLEIIIPKEKIFADELLTIKAMISNESDFVTIKNLELELKEFLEKFEIEENPGIDFLKPKQKGEILSELRPKEKAIGTFEFKPLLTYEDDEGEKYQKECEGISIEVVERPIFLYDIQIAKKVREAHDFIIRVSVKNDSEYSTIKDISFDFSESKKDFSGEFKFGIPELEPKGERVKNLRLKPEFSGEIMIIAKISYESDEKHYETKEYRVEVKEREKILITIVEPGEIEIKRGYEILQNNDLRFGIRVINNTGYMIGDVETKLDYPKTLFSLKGNVVQTLANIPPKGERTATYILTPLGCIHNEKIDATIFYNDHTGEKHTVQMHPKEVHCVCPFLKENAMREGEFAQLANNSEHVEEGLSFTGIDVNEITEFIKEACARRLCVINEHEIDAKKIVNLAGESIGEKTHYLLTAVIQPYKNVTQVALRAYSDKPYGLHGFLNEIANSIRYLVGSVQSAKEIGVIESKQVINIIGSVAGDYVTEGKQVAGGDIVTGTKITGEVYAPRSTIGGGEKVFKNCPYCGEEVQRDEKFCTECRARLG